MSKYFSINGYWKDDKSEFSDYIIKETDDIGEDDEDIFFYGMNEEDIKETIAEGEETMLDFVITEYQETEL